MLKKNLIWYILCILFTALFIINDEGFLLLLAYISLLIPFRRKIEDRE